MNTEYAHKVMLHLICLPVQFFKYGRACIYLSHWKTPHFALKTENISKAFLWQYVWCLFFNFDINVCSVC